MTRRRTFLTGVAVLTIGVAVSSVVLISRRGESPASAASTSSSSSRITAKVAKRDLVQTTSIDGTLGYGSARDLAIQSHGVITALPAVGSVIDRGGEVAEVDGRPVSLLFGDRPAWRDLQADMSDGPDVEQLEANLVAMGYGTAAALGPNETWSQATTDAVKRWQRALGVDDSGVVALGDVVFEPGAVRVNAQNGSVGAQAGGPLLKVTDTTRLVDASLDASQQTLVKPGDKVDVVLPDSSTTAGTIYSVGAVASAGQNGSDPTIPLTIALDDQSAGAGLDQAPVTVKITSGRAADALAVPVTALLALAEGGYAVEKVTGATSTLVGVETGVFADGWVQVTGDVHEGDEVVTAQ